MYNRQARNGEGKRPFGEQTQESLISSGESYNGSPGVGDAVFSG